MSAALDDPTPHDCTHETFSRSYRDHAGMQQSATLCVVCDFIGTPPWERKSSPKIVPRPSDDANDADDRRRYL